MKTTLTFIWKNPSLVVGAVFFILVLLAAVFGPILSPYSPIRGAGEAHLAPPLSKGHPLGTDALSRDIATRLAYGLRISLVLSGTAVLISMVVGVGIGMVAGFRGGWIDSTVMRLVDVQLAFPFILLALTAVAIFPSSVPVLIALLALAAWVLFARTIRGSVLREVNSDYVQAAVTLGASRVRIALRYVLPNLLPTIVALATLEFAALILFEATLSFLGVGIKPPTPSLGGMMLEGQTYLRTAWWITTLPGIALFVTTMSLNLLSEGLRAHLDPRLQGLR
jgi:peptide/nickel transport system permease protein